MLRVGNEFVDEDIVVGCVANGTADDTNGEGKGRDGGNEILLWSVLAIDK